MHYLVYKITNTKNDKIYIGTHQTNNKEDSYMGSGYRLKKAIAKHGLLNFKKEILIECISLDEMFEIEKRIVNETFLNRIDVYNVALGGKSGGFHGRKHSLEAISKIRNASAGRNHSNETKEKISKRLKGNPLSEDTKMKMSISAKKRFSDLTERKKLSIANSGKKRKPLSEETKQKIRNTFASKIKRRMSELG